MGNEQQNEGRMEQARGDVLMDGKFTLSGEGGLTMEADFGVPAGNETIKMYQNSLGIAYGWPF